MKLIFENNNGSALGECTEQDAENIKIEKYGQEPQIVSKSSGLGSIIWQALLALNEAFNEDESRGIQD